MRTLALATLTASAALMAAPALAQPAQPAYDTSVEALTVTGHLPGFRIRSLSERVSYADLDLNYAGDRRRLEIRVNSAARRVCTQLNEASPSAANLGKSCQDRAVRDAMGQIHQAYADASSSSAYVDRYGTPTSATEPDPDAYGPQISTNGPIPDTPANRARYGAPLSAAGKRTSAIGN
ncbi:UrcA family protein [Phenylobacterium sp.]|jgi:UrcA family protein|uniref:UrcA family protein n=1 Tax=Phenylobacterium sp. TaxID=1871053 RepID=UPI002F41E846